MNRNSAVVHNIHIYPTLHNILEEKFKCFPENIHFSEISAKCTLQSMSSHTVSRVSEMIDMLSLAMAMMSILPEEHLKVMKFFQKFLKLIVI